ncbi:hypothetical protein BAL199_21284 [alpha proteobacterium BAL199]|nr:hypothetical protein BAL199_21284 [alpha proteobacterium BAL199]
MTGIAEKGSSEPGDGTSVVALVPRDQACQMLDRCSALAEDRYDSGL